MFTISLIGWVHTFTCVFAMLAGGVALFAIKGSVDHKSGGVGISMPWRSRIYQLCSSILMGYLIYFTGWRLTL